MKKIITLTALLCTMCLMFSCHDTSPAPMLLNGQYVESLDEAIAAMKAGDTLQVTRDLDVVAPIAVDKEITIELLGGAKIEYDGEGSAFDVKEGGSLVIKGQSAGSGKSGMYRSSAAGGTVIEADGPVEALFKVGPGATLELENVTLIGENKPYCGLILINNPTEDPNGPVIKLTDVRAIASKSVITSYAHGEANDLCSNDVSCTHFANATVEIKGGYFEKTSSDAYFGNENCIYLIACKGLIEGAEVVSRNGACIEVSCSDVSGEAIKIKDCTVTSNFVDKGDASKYWQGTAVAASLKGEIEIEGGTYTGLYALATYNGNKTPDGTITCTGATLRGSIDNVSKTGGDGFISVDGIDY